MKLRPFLPAAAVISALAATTAAYHLAAPRADPPPPQPEADRGPDDSKLEAMLVRSVARGLVARDVIAGRTTVPEAAALFGWLDARSPWTKAAADGRIAADAGLSDAGGYTDAEMHGVRVVAVAAAVAGSLPCLPPGGVGRARGEFLAARARGEFARLPEVSADRGERLLATAQAEARKVMPGRPDACPVRAVQ